MKINLTVQDLRNLKRKFEKYPDLQEFVEAVELMFIRAEDQKTETNKLKTELDELKKDLKKAERKWTIELNRVSSRIK